MKIDFLILGAQKSGTSALVHFLKQHPQIDYCKKKEGHFFDKEENFTASPVDYSPYHQLFSFDKLISGESSPSYLYWKPAPQRAFEYNPNLKLIVSLRNPIERAFSHWNMMSRRGWDKKSFSEAIREESQRVAKDLPLQNKPLSYVDRGFYSVQLTRWFEYFSPEQFLIIKNTQIKKSHQETLDTIFSFLGVEKIALPEEDIHARIYDTVMSSEDKHWLLSVYQQEIKDLERLLGWDCSEWLE